MKVEVGVGREDRIVKLIMQLAREVWNEMFRKIDEYLYETNLKVETMYDVIDRELDRYKEVCEVFDYEEDECVEFLVWTLEKAMKLIIDVAIDEYKIRDAYTECKLNKYCWI